jgi:hypothetical protein
MKGINMKLTIEQKFDLKGKSMNERKVLEITGDLSGSPA